MLHGRQMRFYRRTVGGLIRYLYRLNACHVEALSEERGAESAARYLPQSR